MFDIILKKKFPYLNLALTMLLTYMFCNFRSASTKESKDENHPYEKITEKQNEPGSTKRFCCPFQSCTRLKFES